MQGSVFRSTINFILVISISLATGCTGGNILSEFAKEDTDEALLKAAEIHINKSQWDSAISKFASMSEDFAAKRESKIILASAYAGKCGLNLLGLAEGIVGTLGSLLFKFLMQQYPGATTDNRDNCKLAEAVIKSISTDASERNVDENLFMFFLSLAKIGITISAHADSVLVDGEPDAGWDGCTDDAANFPEVSVREVGSGLAIALTSLTAVGGGSSVGSNELTVLTNLCSALETLGPIYNFCAVTDATLFTADHITAIRSLVRANEFVGIGSCNNTLALCVCP